MLLVQRFEVFEALYDTVAGRLYQPLLLVLVEFLQPPYLTFEDLNFPVFIADGHLQRFDVTLRLGDDLPFETLNLSLIKGQELLAVQVFIFHPHEGGMVVGYGTFAQLHL